MKVIFTQLTYVATAEAFSSHLVGISIVHSKLAHVILTYVSP
jgi:hypothetical protein